MLKLKSAYHLATWPKNSFPCFRPETKVPHWEKNAKFNVSTVRCFWDAFSKVETRPRLWLGWPKIKSRILIYLVLRASSMETFLKETEGHFTLYYGQKAMTMTLQKPSELITMAVPWTIEIVIFLCGHGPSSVVYVHTSMVQISIKCYLIPTMWTFNTNGYSKSGVVAF